MLKKISLSKPTWIILMSAIVIIPISIWFFNNFDRVYYEINTGYSEEAKRNKFLAAQIFLKKIKTIFEIKKDFTIFDKNLNRNNTVLINSSRIGMSTQHRDKMKKWVEQGGHLILVATEDYEHEFNASKDPFLDELGLRYYDIKNDYTNTPEEDLTHLKFDGYEQSTEVHFFAQGYIEDTSGKASFIAGNQYADYLVQYSLGKGLLTVLIDFSIWENQRINQHDHAMFLAQLIGDSKQVWLIYNNVKPSLLMLSIQHIPLILFSSVVILVLILFGQLWRKGALLKDEKFEQRAIMQHIEAAGEFSFRYDQGHSLLSTVLQSIELRMCQLVHGYSQLDRFTQLEKLALKSSFSIKELTLLWQQEQLDKDRFLQKIQLAQAIRKQL